MTKQEILIQLDAVNKSLDTVKCDGYQNHRVITGCMAVIYEMMDYLKKDIADEESTAKDAK